MRMRWLLCVLMGTLAWGQAAPAAPPPQPGQAPMVMGGRLPAQVALPDTSSSVPSTAVVITIDGVCPPQPKPATAAAKGAAVKPAADTKTTAPKPSPADCKTTITKAQFEKLISSLVTNHTPTIQEKKRLAGILPGLLAMSTEAKKEGMDKTDAYKEYLKYAQMQILTNQLTRKIQEDAGKISPADIESYYKAHPDAFEQFNVDRLFVPRTKQGETEAKDDDDKDEKLTDEQKKVKEDAVKAKAGANEQAMTKLADDLRARAAAGEDIAKLQKEAYEAAGMKIESPTVNLPNVRRTGLPPGHASIFDLKAGDVSQVISDSGGHYIYKVNSKTEMSLEQATNEITTKMKNDRMREEMEKLNSSYHAQTNPDYFGPDTGPMPPPRGPRPHPGMPPTGAAPQQPGPAATQPQGQPPAAQPEAPKPN